MRISFRKPILLATLLLSSYSLAQADTVPVTPPPATVATPAAPAAPAATGNSNAVAFAVEAGSIAGAAQACGQDVSVFVSRVNQALNKLSANPNDRVTAIASFQKALQQAQTAQTTNHPLQCSQVAQDYNSLPILRPDYERTVISQLSPNMTATTTNTTPPNANTSTGQQPPVVTPGAPPVPLTGPPADATAPVPATTAPAAVPPPPAAAEAPPTAPTDSNNNPYQNTPDQNNPPAASY